jgi:small subunit ribosomal protein S16
MDSRKRRDGAAIEELGWFNPIEADKSYSLNEDRILHWMKLGAQTSEAAHGLMKHSGLAHRWHLTQQGLDENASDVLGHCASLTHEPLQKFVHPISSNAECGLHLNCMVCLLQ